MRSLSMTALRTGLCGVLDQVKRGEAVEVTRRGKPVARIVPPSTTNWRDGVTVQARLRVPAEEAFAPTDDI